MEQNQLTSSLLRQHYYSKWINIYSVLIVLVAIFMGFFVYEKFDEYSYKTGTVSQMQALEENLKKTQADLANKIASNNEIYTNQIAGRDESLNKAFPKTEDFTEIVRSFDKFSQSISTGSNPAVATSIKFDAPTSDKTNSYQVLPFTMNLNVTKANFDKFLQYVYESGDLKKQSRLLEIRSFSLSIPPQEQAGKGLTLTVKMEAYLQKK